MLVFRLSLSLWWVARFARRYSRQSNFDMLIVNWRSNNETMLAMYHKETLSPDFWDTPPLAITLRGAAQGFLEHTLLGNIVPEIIKRSRRLPQHSKV